MPPTVRTRRARPLGLLLSTVALTGALAGCGLFGTDDDPAPTPATSTSTTIPEPATELLDPGEEPRRPLRYAFVPAEVTVDVVLDLDVTQDPDGEPVVLDLPPIRQRVRLVTGATNGGATEVELVVEALAVDPAGLRSASQRAELDGDLEPLVGLRGTGRVDDRGRLSAFRYEAPADLDAELQGLVDGMSGQVAAMIAPLPAEPVGVGARWRSTTVSTAGGATVPVTTVFQLTAVTEDEVTYASTVDGSASDLPLDLPDAPAGTTARLRELRSNGRGSGTFSLHRLDATARARSETTQTVVVTAPDGSQVIVDQTSVFQVLIGPLAEADTTPDAESVEPAGP